MYGPVTFTTNELNEVFDFLDLLVRDAFITNSEFSPVKDKKQFSHPTNIKYKDSVCYIEVAATGLESKDITVILKQDNRGTILNVKHTKNEKAFEGFKYEVVGISQKSFDFEILLSSKLDTDKLEAEVKNGLLTIKIPFKPEAIPKTIKIS